MISRTVRSIHRSVGAGGATVTITISANVQNFDLYANRLTSQHGAAVTVSGIYSTGSSVSLIINTGIVVGSTSTTTALTTGSSWPAGTSIGIINNGYIVGKGGTGQEQSGSTSIPATAGGLALTIPATQATISITNSGVIGGGGGGGGDGGLTLNPTPPNTQGIYYSGGGGAGYSVGSPGTASAAIWANTNSQPGLAGTLTTGGTYATGSGLASGGSLGQSGITHTTGHPGGAGGAATSGAANATWLVTGTRYGTIG